MLAFGLQRRIRVGADRHLHDARRAIPVVIGHIGAVALILAALHGVASTLWASAYRWLGAFGSFTDASLYSLGTMTTFGVPGWCCHPGGNARRAGGRQRRASLRHQHRVHLRGDAGLLADAFPTDGYPERLITFRGRSIEAVKDCSNGSEVTPSWFPKGWSSQKTTNSSRPSRTATALSRSRCARLLPRLMKPLSATRTMPPKSRPVHSSPGILGLVSRIRWFRSDASVSTLSRNR